MRRSRFGEAAIIGMLRAQAAGLSAPQPRRRHGISDATFRKLRSNLGGKKVGEARRLTQFEEGNGRLIEARRDDDNRHRPQASLDGLTPREYFNRSDEDPTRNGANF